jgi:hypothetical protein
MSKKRILAAVIVTIAAILIRVYTNFFSAISKMLFPEVL